jgi:hypothetical protein
MATPEPLVIIPAAFDSKPTRENAVGLCRLHPTGEGCRHRFDDL